MATNGQAYLTVEELAMLLRCSAANVYNMRWRGEGPPAVKIRNRVLFPKEEVEAWLDQHRERQSA